MARTGIGSAPSARKTLPTTEPWWGTRRPTQLVEPTMWRLSRWSSISTAVDVATPRLAVSPLARASRSSASPRELDEIGTRRLPVRVAKEHRPRADRAARRIALHEPLALERTDEPRGRALRQPRQLGELADGRRVFLLDHVDEQLRGSVDRLGSGARRHGLVQVVERVFHSMSLGRSLADVNGPPG